MPGAGSVASRKAAELSVFMDFYDREYHLVVRFVMNCGASLAAAEDAAQEAFLDAWKLMSAAGKWVTVDDPRRWIRAVALNKYRRPPGFRKAPPTILHPVVEDTEDTQVSLVDVSASTLHVIDALRSLEPELQAVMAFDLEGFTAAEAGRYLGLTDQQVRDRRKKARKILAGKLGVTGSETRSDR
jgi:RNA polymerase sigma factor (sigma-70 family)